MSERRTAPQTIRVAPEPAKAVNWLDGFKADLRQQGTAGIRHASADAEVMSRAPPGAKEAIETELQRRGEPRDPDQATVEELLEALTWPQLQEMLRRVKGPGQIKILAEVRLRSKSGDFGPRS